VGFKTLPRTSDKQKGTSEMNITQLEKEIVKAIDIERDTLDKLDTHTTLDTLDYSFIDLKKFVRKCFKEHNEE
jgi:hypothetical protein